MNLLSLKDQQILEEVKILNDVENFIIISSKNYGSNLKSIISILDNKKNFIFLDNLGDDLKHILNKLNPEETCIISLDEDGKAEQEIIILKNLLLRKFSHSLSYVFAYNEESPLLSLVKEYSENFLFVQIQENISSSSSLFSYHSLLPLKLAGIDYKNILINLSKFYNFNFDDKYKKFLDTNISNNKKTFLICIFDNEYLGFASWLKRLLTDAYDQNKFDIFPIILDCNKELNLSKEMLMNASENMMFYILPVSETRFDETKKLIHTNHSKFISDLENRNASLIAEDKVNEVLMWSWVNALNQ